MTGEAPETWSWAALAASIAVEDDLPEPIRHRALIAIPRLEHHLGRGWPQRAQTVGHPLEYIFFNLAAWTRVRLAEVADAMDAVGALPDWASLRRRVRNPAEGLGALLELDVAGTALRRGLAVALQPRTTGASRADLCVTAPGRRSSRSLYVEITRVRGMSVRASESHDFYGRLCPQLRLLAAGLFGAGKVLREIHESERPQILAITDAFWDRCLETRSLESFVIPGVLEFTCVPLDEGAITESDGRVVTFEAPVSDDPVGRTIRAVIHKVRQLPALAPGIIVVQPPPATILAGGQVLADQLQRHISRFPQVSAVVVVQRQLAAHSAGLHLASAVRGHEVLDLPDSHIWMKRVVLCWNATRRFPAQDDLVRRVL